jgi:hypothetical protein
MRMQFPPSNGREPLLSAQTQLSSAPTVGEAARHMRSGGSRATCARPAVNAYSHMPSMPPIAEEELEDALTAPSVVSMLDCLASPPGAPQINPRTHTRVVRTAQEVPPYMRCALTGELLTDPVILEDTYSYEREPLRDWLQTHRCSPKTGQMLGSTKFFPNSLLKAAIERRQRWIDTQGNAPTASYYCSRPPRGLYGFVEPINLSDGNTFDKSQALTWLDGRRRSPGNPDVALRDWELFIPNRAVAAMTYDDGYPMPYLGPYVEKHQMWSTPHRCLGDDLFGTAAAGGILAALCSVSVLACFASCVPVAPAAYGAVAGSSAAGACMAGAMGHTYYADSRARAEEARRGGQHKFNGP